MPNGRGHNCLMPKSARAMCLYLSWVTCDSKIGLLSLSSRPRKGFNLPILGLMISLWLHHGDRIISFSLPTRNQSVEITFPLLHPVWRVVGSHLGTNPRKRKQKIKCKERFTACLKWGNHWDYSLSNILPKEAKHGDFTWGENILRREHASEGSKLLNMYISEHDQLKVPAQDRRVSGGLGE